MNEEDYIKSTHQNSVDPTEWNGQNPKCNLCYKEAEQFDDFCEDHQRCVMCGDNDDCECEDEWSEVSACCEARMDADQGLCYSCKDHCESVWDDAVESNNNHKNTLK